MAKVIATETDEHRAAFQHCLGQGPRRTLAATATRCGVSQTTDSRTSCLQWDRQQQRLRQSVG
jgi:hypothetical protein